MKRYTEVFRKMVLFTDMDPERVPEILHCLKGEVRRFPKGAYLFTEGDPAKAFGIVLEGKIRIVRDHYDGRRSVIGAFGPGELFAESFALMDGAELPVSILAEEECCVLLIPGERILHPCETACTFHTGMLLNLLKISASKNLILNRKLWYVGHKTTGEKLMAYLKDQERLHHSKEFEIPFDRQALADYLGVERSAMSAEIGKLRRQGLIETRKNRFRILEQKQGNSPEKWTV